MTREAPSPNKGDQRSIGALIADITGQFSGLVRGELQLAQANVRAKVMDLGIGGVLLAIAGVLALFMLGFLLAGVAWLIAQWLPVWASFMIVAAVLLVLALLFAAVGAMKLKDSKKYKVEPGKGIKQTFSAAKDGFTK